MQFFKVPSVFNEWISLNKQQNLEVHRSFFVCFLLFVSVFCLKVHSLFSRSHELQLNIRHYKGVDIKKLQTFCHFQKILRIFLGYRFVWNVAKMHILSLLSLNSTSKLNEMKENLSENKKYKKNVCLLWYCVVKHDSVKECDEFVLSA